MLKMRMDHVSCNWHSEFDWTAGQSVEKKQDNWQLLSLVAKDQFSKKHLYSAKSVLYAIKSTFP